MVLENGQFRFMFTARDYASAVAFYRDGLQLPLDHDWDFGPGDAGSVFKAGMGMIEVFSPAPDAEYVRPSGISMLLQVDNVDEWMDRALERDLSIEEEPRTQTYGQRTLRLRDPDGIIVTLFHSVPVGAS